MSMTKRGHEVVKSLTANESIVAALVATGRGNREIAQRLGTSQQMVKNHCKSLFDKTGTESRFQFVMFCLGQGIIERPRA